MKFLFLAALIPLIVFGLANANANAIENPLELFMPSSEKPIIPDTSAMSPRAQMLAGLSASQVMCKEGLNLVIKAVDGSPACVKASTVPKLIEINWISMEKAFGEQTEAEQVPSETEETVSKKITSQMDFLQNESDRAMYFVGRFSQGLITETELTKSTFFKFTPFKEQSIQITPENPIPKKTPFRFALESLPSKDNIGYYRAIDDYFQIDSPTFKVFDASIDVVSGDGTVLQTWEYTRCDLEDYVVYLQDNIIFNKFHGGMGPEIRDRSIFLCGGFFLQAPEN